MREMRGEVGKKNKKKKRWIISHFYDVKWLIFYTLCQVTYTKVTVCLSVCLAVTQNPFNHVHWFDIYFPFLVNLFIDTKDLKLFEGRITPPS